jgi:hypothetical protein
MSNNKTRQEYIDEAEYDIAEFISNRIEQLSKELGKKPEYINTTIFNNRDGSSRDYGWILKKASITFDKEPPMWIEHN